MIYPTNTGKSGEHLRLSTLESVWIQGKLRMWGRWSYIGSGKPGNMFNQLLTSKKLTKTEINEALRMMKKAGLDKPELEAFLRDMINAKQKSWLAHCTDSEALIIDRVIGEVLADHHGLYNVLSLRYMGRGMSKRMMAERLNEVHPEWCFSTCEKRIANWLAVAEYKLYIPMNESFAQKMT
ncbi:DUF1133 family protein [Citrobacter braakii]|uniref:DUF1133 family protein n=1 Tax=Citrobacter braakii TaxID=57706 RepID=UPI002B252409|nr:DUF1133 family protein [Citrobacter braakii]MEB0967916.1 DUF1133 family protein [Citrobacter braakii]